MVENRLLRYLIFASLFLITVITGIGIIHLRSNRRKLTLFPVRRATDPSGHSTIRTPKLDGFAARADRQASRKLDKQVLLNQVGRLSRVVRPYAKSRAKPSFGIRPANHEPSLTSKSGPSEISRKTRLVHAYTNLPLHFERQDTEVNSNRQFIARGAGYGLSLSSSDTLLVLQNAAALRIQFVGANADAVLAGQEVLPTRSNYFIGQDPSRWKTGIAQYGKIQFKDVYPGIDLAYYGNQHQLESDLVIAPHADPTAIELQFETVRGNSTTGSLNSPIASPPQINTAGDLVLDTGAGEVRLLKPRIYQRRGNINKPVGGRYILKAGNRVGFELDAYDAGQPLVIDPTLTFAARLGGTGTDVARGIAVDPNGNSYVTGSTTARDFPTAGPLQPALAGGSDVFVAKLNPAGTLIYSTFLRWKKQRSSKRDCG
ncbi:MAG TPA: SBBP repeat-containing protein [Acidobacteriota bacterium]|jgi:hypothetical protein